MHDVIIIGAGPAGLSAAFWCDELGLDTLVLADVTVPADVKGRPVDKAAYLANLKAWVQRGGNLVLTDKGGNLQFTGKYTGNAVGSIDFGVETATDSIHIEFCSGSARQNPDACPSSDAIHNSPPLSTCIISSGE